MRFVEFVVRYTAHQTPFNGREEAGKIQSLTKSVRFLFGTQKHFDEE